MPPKIRITTTNQTVFRIVKLVVMGALTVASALVTASAAVTHQRDALETRLLNIEGDTTAFKAVILEQRADTKDILQRLSNVEGGIKVLIERK